MAPPPRALFLHCAGLLLGSASGRNQTCRVPEVAKGNQLVQTGSGLRRHSGAALESRSVSEHVAASNNYGTPGCQCIGIDWPHGMVKLPLDGLEVVYPRNMGSSCETWDYGRHPACQDSRAPSWCKKSWCFVDACSCNLTTAPKVSTYLPNSTFQGRKVYYSYATCGETDDWTADNNAGACVNQKTAASCRALSICSWSDSHGCVGSEVAAARTKKKGICAAPVDLAVFGTSGCRCIGFDTPHGTMEANAAGVHLGAYPAGVGSKCQAWDNDRHPLCSNGTSGALMPPFCSQRWCYVDPCSCTAPTPPKQLTYFEGALFQGKPLFYSYSTCGSADNYTSRLNQDACPNFATGPQCWTRPHCAWTQEKRCVQKEVAKLCGLAPIEPLPTIGHGNPPEGEESVSHASHGPEDASGAPSVPPAGWRKHVEAGQPHLPTHSVAPYGTASKSAAASLRWSVAVGPTAAAAAALAAAAML